MLRMRGAPLAKLGLEAAIFASSGWVSLTLLTPVYRWIVQTVWQNGSWMIFSANYRSTECKEWGPVLQAVREAMKKQDISKTNAKSERHRHLIRSRIRAVRRPPEWDSGLTAFPRLVLVVVPVSVTHPHSMTSRPYSRLGHRPVSAWRAERRALEKERRESSHRQGGQRGERFTCRKQVYIRLTWLDAAEWSADLGAYWARAEHSLRERHKQPLLRPDFPP